MAGDPRGRNVVAAGLLRVRPAGGRERLARAPTTARPGRSSSPAPGVKGGFYGEQPSLTDLDNGDLKASTDFRVVYAELLDKVLGTDPGKVLGAERPALGLIG